MDSFPLLRKTLDPHELAIRGPEPSLVDTEAVGVALQKASIPASVLIVGLIILFGFVQPLSF
ncbi:MAG TPA: hypothetical protein VEB18_03750 [Candidatus Paceibacterota bacterium]|nr:hypothetical protein [Candidatus Paceibacterota bacterium]